MSRRQLALLSLQTSLLLLLRVRPSGASFEALQHGLPKASPSVGAAFAVDYLALYEEGVNQLPSLNVADPMILAALWSRTGNELGSRVCTKNMISEGTCRRASQSYLVTHTS